MGKKKTKSAKSVLKTGAIIGDGEKFKTPLFRLSFPHVFSPASFDGGKPTYDVSMIFDDEKTDLSLMKKWVEKEVKSVFGKKTKKVRRPFRDGEEKDDQDGYGEGKTFAKASSKFKPGVYDVDRDEILDESEVYPGCYCRAIVTLYSYTYMGKKGISLGLASLQKMKDGDPLGRSSSPDDYED